MNELSVIQGDTLDIELTIDNDTDATIETVTLICRTLDVKLELGESAESSNVWVGQVDADVTAAFRQGRFLYDVVVQTDDENITTIIHNAVLEVKGR